MRNSSRISLIVLVLLVVVGIFWFGGSSKSDSNKDREKSDTPVVSETIKVSNTLSEYKNVELGFSVKYPSAWQSEETNSGVTFIIPIDKNQISTVGTLQGSIEVRGGVCAFPPVTSVKERGTLKVGESTLNTISMSNTVQGRSYFNRMYSLQKGEICYVFSFASITLSPASKNLTGSNLTQAENNNKAIISETDKDFTEMVKTFSFVVAPQGIDETKAKPAPAPTATSTKKSN